MKVLCYSRTYKYEKRFDIDACLKKKCDLLKMKHTNLTINMMPFI